MSVAVLRRHIVKALTEIRRHMYQGYCPSSYVLAPVEGPAKYTEEWTVGRFQMAGEPEVFDLDDGIPVVEAEPDVCSICLDSFTPDDPGQVTECNHEYHLQCIMQWAQRSRECPMCFKALRLKDPSLNELLPFGEYVSKEQLASTAPHFLVGLDAWDLDRLLTRLAVANSGPSAAQPSRRERGRQRNRSSAIPTTSAGTHAAAGVPLDCQDDSVAGRGFGSSAGVDIATTSSSGAQTCTYNGGTGIEESGNDADDASRYPSSWPPPSARNHLPQSPTNTVQSPRGGLRPSGSLDFRAASESLKSRFGAVSMRCKESISKTTRELKARLGKGPGLPTSPTSSSRPTS
ncbi:hypothetical protein WJX72_011777 [[Myrmecia] bisecta]|uniref:RING-type E3 ubiquitin transferase n=1 Tax=[Myrmecia] bisecta TaxID=41462 RepID=A0AAW1PUN5_9CHLO